MLAPARTAEHRFHTSPSTPMLFAFWLLASLRLPVPRLGAHAAIQPPLRFDQVLGLKQIPWLRSRLFTTRRLVRIAHKKGLAVHVWTVNETAEMELAFHVLKVDGIISDVPSRLAAVLFNCDSRPET